MKLSEKIKANEESIAAAGFVLGLLYALFLAERMNLPGSRVFASHARFWAAIIHGAIGGGVTRLLLYGLQRLLVRMGK